MSSNPSSQLKIRTIMAFGAVYLIWGSTYLAIRFAIETLPSFLLAGVRFFLAGLVLYAFASFKNNESLRPKQWGPAFISGTLLLLGGNGFVVLAEHSVPSGLAALFIAIVPLWMVLLEWWWLKTKRPSLGVFLGIGIGFLGVWLLIAPDFLHLGAQSINLTGALWLLGASLSWSGGSIYTHKADLPKSPFLATAMQMIGGGTVLLLLSLLSGEWTHFHIGQASVKSVLAMFYLVTFGSLIAFTAYLWLLKNVGVARTSTYAFVNPVVAILLGWAFAGERLNIQTALAAILVLVAVMVITIYHKHK